MVKDTFGKQVLYALASSLILGVIAVASEQLIVRILCVVAIGYMSERLINRKGE